MAACAWALTGDIGRRDGVCLLAFGVVLMLLVSCALLILRARVRVHVVMPLAFCAMMSLVMCAHAPVASSIGVHARVSERGGSRGSRGMALPIAALLFSVVACGGFWAVVVRPLRAQAAAPTVAAVADYVEENPDQLVVFARTQTLLYPSYDAFSFERWFYPENVLQVGGWMSHTAPWRDFLERHDLSLGSTFADLADRDDVVTVVADGKVDVIRAYLEGQTGRGVEVEVLEDLGPGLIDTSSRIVACRFESV